MLNKLPSIKAFRFFMICTKCNNEWFVTKGQPMGNCPKCGADSLLMLNDQLSKLSVEGYLQNIIIVYGIEILSDKKRLSAIIGDLFNYDKEVKKLLHLSIQNDVPIKLHNIYNSKTVDLSMQISAFKTQVYDNSLLRDDAIKQIFQYWSLALNPPKSLSTEPETEDGEWIDEFGVKYSADGLKLFEGNRKTLEGIYEIDSKTQIASTIKTLGFHILIIMTLKTQKKAGKSPRGDFKIHGYRNNSALAHFNIRYQWTLGCIALNNKDMDELFEVIKIGTSIEIVP